ncbi:MAG: hydroxymethylbilane synthase [Acidobacteriota bacterium]
MPDELRLGTRGSQLALWQAHTVASRLQDAGGPPCRIVVIKTSGDRLQDAPLSEIGGKRLFVKEIEDALLREEIDLAVHSSKDMPAMLLESLTIGAVLPREDPLDAIVLPQHMTIGRDAIRGMTGDVDLTSPVIAGLSPTAMSFNQVVAALGPSPSLGTGSVRRIAQLTRLFPQARFAPIRGNLDTRLRKLDGGDHDAIVLAAAGLRRLGMASRISVRLPSSACVPAPGQGIVAIEIRQRDADVAAALRQIDDPVAHAALRAERAVVEALGGGCQTPVGALATPVAPDGLELLAVVVSLDGSRAIYGMSHGTVSDPVAVGRRVGAQLMADGAGDILADAHRIQASIGGIQP